MVKGHTGEYKNCVQHLDSENSKENNNSENTRDVRPECINEEETKCGIACYHPRWIQKLASQKIYALIYGIFGLVLYGEMSMFQGNISSLEKNFSLSSKAVGMPLVPIAFLILGSLKTIGQAGSVVANFMAYAADRGNKIRWLVFASCIFTLGCALSVLPIFSPISLHNINAYSSPHQYDNHSTIRALNKENTCDLGNDNFNFFRNLIILPFVVSQFLIGFATALHRSCGAAYLDDNTRKNVFPIWFASVYSTQWCGYALGLILTSYALKIYVFPTYTPNITNNDPRWIGAWWLGTLLLAGVGLLLCPIFLLFPRSLPRAAMRRQKTTKSKEISWKDFFKTLRSILGNKILMLETISTTVFSLGLYATFWPKFIEVQYGMTPSKSTLMQGFIEFVARPLGMLTTSILIVKIKPRPRILLGWNLVLTCTAFMALLALIFTRCEKPTIRGHEDERNNWILTEECNAQYNCSANLKYEPVCDRFQNEVFFSSCHAGCQSLLMKDNITEFNHCDCAPNSDHLEGGVCHTNCATTFTAYVLLIGWIKVAKASSRSIKAVVEFRAMKENEKSFSIGIMRTIQSLFSTLPALVIYGALLDASCLVWDKSCGTRGNCWLYDANKLRQMFFITSSTFMGISVILDFLICIYVKSLKIYDEDFIDDLDQSGGNTKIQNGNTTQLLLTENRR